MKLISRETFVFLTGRRWGWRCSKAGGEQKQNHFHVRIPIANQKHLHAASLAREIKWNTTRLFVIIMLRDAAALLSVVFWEIFFLYLWESFYSRFIVSTVCLRGRNSYLRWSGDSRFASCVGFVSFYFPPPSIVCPPRFQTSQLYWIQYLSLFILIDKCNMW